MTHSNLLYYKNIPSLCIYNNFQSINFINSNIEKLKIVGDLVKMLLDVNQNKRFWQGPRGIVYYYDSIRNKWLSASREVILFNINHKNLSNDRWMAIGEMPSNISGYKLPRNGTITAITVQTNSPSANGVFKIRKNNMSTDLCSASLFNEPGKVVDNLNINIDEGDWLQSLMSVNSGNVNYPVVSLEISWRRY